MGPGTQVSQLEIGWFSTFLLAFGTTSYQCIGDIGTISYLLLKRYSSFLAMIKPKILVTGATGNSLLHHLESTTMNELFKLTRQHYEKNETEVSLLSKVTKILESLPDGSVDSSQLAGLDQFHVMGLAATEQLAQMAAIERGSTILDAGSGLGGPSRYLAGTYGCRVIGVDLSPSFVAIAQLLAQKAGLLDWVNYQTGNLLALSFPDSSFDVVWTQHVVMNIPDRERVYREFRRILRPGGKLAFFDILAADANLELHFPVPWAESSETSFLLTQDETSSVLVTAGFTITAWNDVTKEALKWIVQQKPPTQGFNLGVVMGPRFAEMSANLARNLREGHVCLVMAVCTAASTRS
jgi:ubiquinone/menaquinone biosynthesis C-methylase UbiE